MGEPHPGPHAEPEELRYVLSRAGKGRPGGPIEDGARRQAREMALWRQGHLRRGNSVAPSRCKIKGVPIEAEPLWGSRIPAPMQSLKN